MLDDDSSKGILPHSAIGDGATGLFFFQDATGGKRPSRPLPHESLLATLDILLTCQRDFQDH